MSISVKSLLSAVTVATAFILGCSADYKLVEHKREASFFDQFVNSASEFSSASQKIEEIKLMQTSEDFPLRLAMFDNHQFYYQVDQLGTGVGNWVYQDGGIRLTAKRKFFDLNFHVSAASETGNELVVKFFDRKGYNSFDLNFRNPKQMESDGMTVEKLREYKDSIKDI